MSSARPIVASVGISLTSAFTNPQRAGPSLLKK
jgi:hypothetical protein